MKFARYLQDTQTPEWKKAYIDYRGLKVQLGIIRTQSLQQADALSSFAATNAHHDAPNNEERVEASRESDTGRGNIISARTTSLRAAEPEMNAAASSAAHGSAPPVRRRTSNQEKPSLSLAVASLPPPPRMTGTTSNAPSQQTPLPPRTPRSPPVFPFFRDSGSLTPPPLRTILANLPPANAKFFEMLDAELDKVETFYAEREKEMNERAKRLREQLNELGVHRQMFYQSSAQSKVQSWAKKANLSVPSALMSLLNWLPDLNAKPKEPFPLGGNIIMASESGRGGRRGTVDSPELEPRVSEHARRSVDHAKARRKEGTVNSEGENGSDSLPNSNIASPLKPPDDSGRSPPTRSNSLSLPRLSFGAAKRPGPLDPHEYQHAKRRLRKAVIEHYRGLEVLSNYRILNLTGFRKALKKYEKITKHTVLDAYMKEKVEPSAIASGAMVNTMVKEMEDFFTMRFERGDRKRAIDRLRVGPSSKTHHFSTFRSGWWLGLALPAIMGGAHLAFKEETRSSLPSWNILLFMYSVLVVPVLLALLIGINIAVWARERINYVFIFELNPRSRLDHHEYFELPSFLLCALAYAFCLSLLQIGPPMLWPLVWLALTLGVMFNPIHSFMWGRARWWTIKNVAKLGASGIWKVEFTDFWLGDQFTSLVYSLSNLYFIGCFYSLFFIDDPLSSSQASLHATVPVNVTTPPGYPPGVPSIAKRAFQSLVSSAYDPRAQEAWSRCGTARNWGWYYLLGVLPFLIRFVQSVRRYRDSRLPTHLINAGKYGMGMIYYFFYYHWRNQEDPHVGASYILWCFTAAAYAIYACSWDFLMDWSVCKPHARYPLLRSELVFKSQIPSYYFALVSNICIRFMWLIYVPNDGPDFTTRTFIVAMLEMLRRVQWNFYRLENEHLGNMDQYRVTREVPLPYTFDAPSNEEEEEQDGDGDADGDVDADVAGSEQAQAHVGRRGRAEEGEGDGDGDGNAGRTQPTPAPRLKKRRMMIIRSKRNGGHG